MLCKKKNTRKWDQEGWEMKVGILNPSVKENLTKATAEERLHHGEGMSLWDMPPSHPLPTVPCPVGSCSII